METTDTDINKVIQQNRTYVAWPALVHRYTPAKPGTDAKDFADAKPEVFTHKKVETEDEHKKALGNGWFATPQKAVEAATKAPAPVTPNEDDPAADATDPDATDDSGKPKGKRA